MAYSKIYERPDGSRLKIEPVLEIDSFDNDAFQWSYIVYRAEPGQEKYEDMTDEHLQGVGVCYGAGDPGMPAGHGYEI